MALSLSYPFSLGRDIQAHGRRAAARAQTPERTECQEVMKVDMSETGNSLPGHTKRTLLCVDLCVALFTPCVMTHLALGACFHRRLFLFLEVFFIFYSPYQTHIILH